MKNAIRTSIAIVSFSLLAACGGPEIDAKNQVTLQESLKNIILELDQKEVAQFQEDLQTITMNVLGDSIQSMDIKKMQSAEGDMLKVLDGMSASDIHKEAERIRNKG